MDVKLNVVVFVVFGLIAGVEPFSRVPSELVNSTWYSNVHGEIGFTTTEMTDWSVSLNGTSTVSWIIIDDTRYTVDGGYIIFRSSSNYTINGTDFYAYMCTRWTKLSNDLYTYYQLHGPNSQFGGERVALWEAPCIRQFEDMCDLTFSLNQDDVNIMAKKGIQSYKTCPEQLVAGIGFTAQNTVNSNLCVGVTNGLDGCSDNTKIQVNSACNYSLVFSVNGSLSCLTETSSGSDGVIYLLNRDPTVDNVNTFRFSCMVISGDGTILSVMPRQCLSAHNSSSFPANTSGQRLFVKTRAMCKIAVSNVYDETRSLWIKIGIPVAIVILFLILLLACAFVACMRVRRKELTYEEKMAAYSTNDKRRVVILQQPAPKPIRAITQGGSSGKRKA